MKTWELVQLVMWTIQPLHSPAHKAPALQSQSPCPQVCWLWDLLAWDFSCLLEIELLDFVSFFFVLIERKYFTDVAQCTHRNLAWLTFGKLVSRQAIFSFYSFLANILENIVDLVIHCQCSAHYSSLG